MSKIRANFKWDKTLLFSRLNSNPNSNAFSVFTFKVFPPKLKEKLISSGIPMSLYSSKISEQNSVNKLKTSIICQLQHCILNNLQNTCKL